MSIFISYRRSASKHLARLIFEKLRARSYDVFLDVTTIDSGAFDRIILNQIAARPHFLLILSPGSLERCIHEGDWLRREIEEAFRLKRNIVPIFDEGFNIEHEKQFLPESLRDELPKLNAPPYSHYYFDAFIDTICSRFLKPPAYDLPLLSTPAAERSEVQRRIEQAAAISSSNLAKSPVATPSAVSASAALSILLPPFDWCPIPAGKVTLINTWDDNPKVYLKKNEPREFTIPAFAIAKYPVTNAQYQVFVDAPDGYADARWWDYSKEAANWWKSNTQLQDTAFTGDDLPRTNVSWYEAVAFCRWLNFKTGESITLPTEQQWQRAAQGDDGRVYPWGDTWDAGRCNNNVGAKGIGKTTPVHQYEGKGDSPYSVVDMSGNVWEWCLTQYEHGSNELNGINERVLRGGSWFLDRSDNFRADFRGVTNPSYGNFYGGFRLARS